MHKLFNQLITMITGSRKGIADTIISMMPNIVSVITGFAGSILLSRLLGPANLGRYALIVSIAAITNAVSDLGIGLTTVFFASRAHAEGDNALHAAIMRWAFRMRVMITLTIALVIFTSSGIIARHLWHDPPLQPLILIAIIGCIFTGFNSVSLIFFQSIKKFATQAIVATLQKLIIFAGIAFLFISHQSDLTYVVFVVTISTVVSSLVFLAIIPRSAIMQRNDFTGLPMLSALKNPAIDSPVFTSDKNTHPKGFSGQMILYSLFNIVAEQLDVWLIAYFLAKDQVGLYNAASRFPLIFSVFIIGVKNALWPRVSSLTNLDDGKNLLKKVLAVSFVATGAGLVYAVAVPMLAPLIFGSQFTASVRLGQLLSARGALVVLWSLISIVANRFGLIRLQWKISLARIVIIGAAFIVLLPRAGLIAATASLIVTEIITVSIITWLIYNYMYKRKGTASIPKTSD